MKTTLINCLAALLLISVRTVSADPGPLTPPGPPGPTGASLGEIETHVDSIPGTPLSQTTTPGDSGDVFVITQPGRYYLTSDLIIPAGLNGISIQAPVATNGGVVLDLRGFKVDGSVSNGVYGINVFGSVNNVLSTFKIEIENGAIIGCSSGALQSSPAVELDIHNMVIRNCPGGLNVDQQGTRLFNCTVVGSATAAALSAIFLGPDSTVSDCIVSNSATGTGSAAISVGANSTVTGCTIVGSGTGAGGAGIVAGNDCHVEACTIAGAYSGIDAGPDCDIERCNVCFSPTNGINGGSNNVVHDCIVHDCGGNGVSLMPYCVAQNDTIATCGWDGIQLQQGCVAENCTINTCGENGLEAFGSFCLMQGNTCTSNGTRHDRSDMGGVAIRANSNVVDGNHLFNNFFFAVVGFTSNNIVLKNVALNNGYFLGVSNDVAQVANTTSVTNPVANVNN